MTERRQLILSIKKNLALQIGGTENLTVTETTTKPDGTKKTKTLQQKQHSRLLMKKLRQSKMVE